MPDRTGDSSTQKSILAAMSYTGGNAARGIHGCNAGTWKSWAWGGVLTVIRVVTATQEKGLNGINSRVGVFNESVLERFAGWRKDLCR